MHTIGFYYRMALISVHFFFSTINLHAQWTQTGGPEGASITDLALQNNRIWAGTWGGLYYSDDKGENWNFKQLVSFNEKVQNLHVFQGKLYFWEISKIDNNQFIRNLYTNDSLGENFHIINSTPGFYQSFTNYTLFSKGDTLFTLNGNQQLSYSANGGVNWQNIPAPVSNCEYTHDGTNILAKGDQGISLSRNGAASWKLIANSALAFNKIHAFKGDHILVGKQTDTPFISTDWGETWSEMPNTMPSFPGTVTQWGFWGDQADTVYANYGSINLSFKTNWTQNWQHWDQWGAEKIVPRFLAPDLGFDINESYQLRKFKFETKSWELKQKGMKGQTLVFFTSNANNIVGLGYQKYMSFSTDYGEHWMQINTEQFNSEIYQIQFKNDTLFLRTKNAIIYNKDLSQSNWDTLVKFPSNYEYTRFTIDGEDMLIPKYQDQKIGIVNCNTGLVTTIPGVGNDFPSIVRMGNRLIMVVDYANVVYSDDLGQNWKISDAPTVAGSFSTKKSIQKLGNRLYLSNNKGLYRSLDAGEHWVQLTQFPIDFPNIFYNPRDLYQVDSLLFASLNPKGVWISKDWGDTWEPWNEGLTNLLTFGFCALNQYLFVGTSFSSVWRYPLATLPTQTPTSIQENPISLFPNPASDQIQLQWQSTAAGTLEIMNAAGNIVLTQTIHAGTQALHLNLPSLPSGWYSVQLRQGSRVSNKPFYLQTNH
jgi:photosystem II stability/assembly factor-like uncharacterized protein